MHTYSLTQSTLGGLCWNIFPSVALVFRSVPAADGAALSARPHVLCRTRPQDRTTEFIPRPQDCKPSHPSLFYLVGWGGSVSPKYPSSPSSSPICLLCAVWYWNRTLMATFSSQFFLVILVYRQRGREVVVNLPKYLPRHNFLDRTLLIPTSSTY